MQRPANRGLGIGVAVLLVLGACTTAETPPTHSQSPAPSPTVAPSSPAAAPSVASPPPTPAPTVEVPSTEAPSATDDGGGCVSLSRDYVEGARGSKGNPIRIARRSLTGLQSTDVLTRARDEDGVAILIARDGQQIGRVHLEPDSHGGWLLTEAMLCGGLGAR